MPIDSPALSFYFYSFPLRKPNAVSNIVFLSVISVDVAAKDLNREKKFCVKF